MHCSRLKSNNKRCTYLLNIAASRLLRTDKTPSMDSGRAMLDNRNGQIVITQPQIVALCW